MSTIAAVGAFLNREAQAATEFPVLAAEPAPTNGEVVKT